MILMLLSFNTNYLLQLNARTGAYQGKLTGETGGVVLLTIS